MWRFLFNPPFFRGLYLQFYISYSILNIHNYKNIQYYKKKISSDIPFNAFIVKWVFFFIFHLIVSVKYIEIMIFVCVFHTIFICDSSSVISSSVTLHLWSLHLWLFICDLFICDLFICAFVFHPWLGTLHWKHKRYQNLKNAIWNKQ